MNPGVALLPCPYCHADAVRLVASGPTFLHYHCTACSEGWTALNAAPRHPSDRAVRPGTLTMMSSRTRSVE